MKVIRFKTTDTPFKVVSINELVKVNIVDKHPEMTLEDQSMIVFDNVDTYYAFIENRELYTQTKQQVNVPKLLTYSEDAVTDPVDPFSYMHMNITSITEIPYSNKNGEEGRIYYVTRSKR